MKKHRKGIALKTFIFTFGLMSLVLFASIGILYAFLPSHYLRYKTEQLTSNADLLQMQLNEHPDFDEAMSLISVFAEKNNANVMPSVINSQKLFDFMLPSPIAATPGNDAPMLILDNMDIASAWFPDGVIAHGEGSIMFTIRANYHIEQRPPTNLGTGVISLRRDLTHPDIGHVTITATLHPIDEARQVIISMLPLLLVAGIVIAAMAAMLFARRLSKPIIEISNAAARMREMEAGVASGVKSNDELGLLAHNLNMMYGDLCENMQGLQAEMERTARLEESKSDFMRAAGHELKTPIAALNGMLEGMIDGVGAYKNQDKYLAECKLQTERLAKLVQDILNVSKLDTDGITPSFTPINVSELLGECVAYYAVMFEEKGLNIEMLDKEPPMLNTDRSVLETVLSNLLSNAVNYSPQGGTISVSLTNDTLYIENQCEQPIDLTLMQKWFEPFYTPDYSRDKSKGGTGLGLYIVKKNLEALKLSYALTAKDSGIRFEIMLSDSAVTNL